MNLKACSLDWRNRVTLIRREKVMHHILIFPPLGPHSKWPQPQSQPPQWQKVISINPVYLSTSTKACKSSSYYEFCIQFCRGSLHKMSVKLFHYLPNFPAQLQDFFLFSWILHDRKRVFFLFSFKSFFYKFPPLSSLSLQSKDSFEITTYFFHNLNLLNCDQIFIPTNYILYCL